LNILERIIVYNYKVPYFIREFLFQLTLIFKNKIYSLHLKKFFKNNQDHINQLNSDGIIFMDNSQPSRIKIDEMTDALDEIDVNKNTNMSQKKISYETEDLASNVQFLSLAMDNEIISLARNYFGAPPKIAFLKAWKVNSGADDLSEMSFHMDHHGHRFLKAFWYLNDVEEGAGHHEYIKKTHYQPSLDNTLKHAPDDLKSDLLQKRKMKGKFLMNNDLVNSFFGENVLKIAGKAGTCFVEDTRGLHRGTKMPEGKFRIIFQVLYVPYLSSKDKNVHHRITNDQVLSKIINYGRNQKLLNKFIFNELID